LQVSRIKPGFLNRFPQGRHLGVYIPESPFPARQTYLAGMMGQIRAAQGENGIWLVRVIAYQQQYGSLGRTGVFPGCSGGIQLEVRNGHGTVTRPV
jgi:hypothetical protein